MRLGVRAALVEGRLVTGDVEVADGRIVRAGIPGAGGTGVAVPGLVDVHINGFGGVDFLAAEPEDYATAGDRLAQSGVTAYLPTFITAPEDDLVRASAVAGEAAAAGRGAARVLGVHLEGPFLAPRYHGVHPTDAMRDPDPALLRRLLDAGPVRLVTLAPERPGALDLVELLAARGIPVSCGHTDATLAQAGAAFDRGARAVTHLFNAMRPLRHRDPGIVGAALTRDDVTVQLILDGDHVAPEAAGIAWRAARGRLCLVTDAISAAGLGDGAYAIGSVAVQVAGGRARLADGTLAGNVRTLLEGVRRLVALGAALEEAVGAATAVPARLVGRTDVGTLRTGAPADVLVLDDRLEPVRVLVGGQTVDA